MSRDPDEAEPELIDGADWSDLEIRGDYSMQSADGVEFVSCRFAGAALTGVTLYKARLIDCVFVDSELSGAVLEDATLTRVSFQTCRMSGFQVPGAHGRDVTFADCRLDGTNLRMSHWERTTFERCDLRDADLYAAEAKAARFIGCDLRTALVSKANLSGANLAGSNLEGIRGGESLRGVVITPEQLIPAALAVFSGLNITIDDGTQGEPDPKGRKDTKNHSTGESGKR